MSRVKGFNPLSAMVALARHNPRAALVVGAMLLVGTGSMLLVAVSSAQAFVMISQQTSNNTQNQFSLTINPVEEEVEASNAQTDSASGSPGADGAAMATTDRSDQPTGTVGPEELVKVNGIRVHHSIVDDITELMAAAEADGVILSGWGWRDSKTQIRLRRQHCGTSEYAIYRMPSSQCSPPTARPGRSQHERGLAIDFTYNGQAIGSRRSPGFKWLAANAAAYGLKNLASEPWHWSTTGR